MSLKSNWQEAPKVVTAGRTVRYAAEPTAWADAAGNTVNLYWTVRRVSSMAFEILALTQAAAEAGAAALQREYTRKYARWTAETDTSVSPPAVRILKTNALLCTSSITPRLVEGSIWHIEATVDEEDTIVTDHEPTYDEFEELFALAFAREEADDDGPSLVIEEAHWDSVAETITVFWDYSNIENFNPSNVTLQRRFGQNWQTIPFVPGSVGHGGGVIQSSQNLGFRVVYNLGQSDEVASAVYITNDPAMPKIVADPAVYSSGKQIAVTFTVSGADIALAGVDVRQRWSFRILANGQYILPDIQGRMSDISQLVSLGDGKFRAILEPWNVYATDESIKAAFVARGGVYTYELHYRLGENTAFASSTITLSDYVVVESAEVIDNIPATGAELGKVRVRLGLGSDFGIGMVSPSAISISGVQPTVERLVNLDEGSFAHAAIVVLYPHETWQLGLEYLNVSGSVPSPSGAPAAFSAGRLDYKFPLRYVVRMDYSDNPVRTFFHVAVHDIYWDTWTLANMIWQKWAGGEWVNLEVHDTTREASPIFACYVDDDLRGVVVRAHDGSDSPGSFMHIPSGADYIRIVKAAGTVDAVVLTIDWRLDGSVLTFDPSKIEAYFNESTVPLVHAVGDELVFDLSGIGELPSPIPVSLVYDGTTYSLPFSFDL